MNEQRSNSDAWRYLAADPAPGSAPAAAAHAPWNDRLNLVARALDNVRDSFCMLDRTGHLVWLNRAMCALLAGPSSPSEQLLGKHLWSTVAALRGSIVERLGTDALAQGAALSCSWYCAPRQRWLDVRAEPCLDGLTLWMQDVTAAHRAEQEARATAALLHDALAAAELGAWQWDPATDCWTLDEHAAALFGLPAGAHHWDALRERIVEADRDLVRAECILALTQHGALRVECRVAGGAGHWIALAARLDQQRRMTGVARALGERPAADASLRQSEEVLRALANSIPQLAWMANAHGHIVWYNERWYEYTGTTPADMLDGGWQAVQDPDVLPRMTERWRASLRSGAPFEMEFPIRGADGAFRWFLTRVNPVRDPQGQVVRWFGTNTDVDQVKRVEQALREESNVLELLNSTGATLAARRDLRSLLHTVADAATDISGARTGAVLYHAGGARSLYLLRGSGAEHEGPFTPARAAVMDDPALRAGGSVRIDDLVADPRYPQEAAALGLPAGSLPVRSYLAVAVAAPSGDALATMFLGHPEPGLFTERTERIVQGIAAQAAVAIDNVRLYEAAQQAADERKVLLENERLMRAEAERASNMKDEFLATLSHELRTPLSSILGWAQVLRRGSRGPDDLNKGLQTIERNARAQAQLIEDLLDMSRITSGKVMLDMQSIAAPVFVDAAIETLRPAAEAKNIALFRRYDPNAGLIAGDPARLQQVIWNLLSNAIKFTPPAGQVEVAIEPIEGHVRIAVRDSGIGLRRDFLPHAFERFRQADSSTTRTHGGLGLGLAIVKHLVEQHGGTVRADSAGEGHGATFLIELPLAKPHASAPRPDRAPSLPRTPRAPEMTLRDLTGVRVLVVDDEVDARELIKRVLSECNAEVLMAEGAAAALAQLSQGRFDVLVSDLGMPGMDGFELLAQVRALGAGAGGNVPAVALTAFARSEDRVRALEAGFWAHIAKPVEPSELIDAVATIVQHRRCAPT